MELELPKGKYVVAVSGGIDSVVLLNLLSNAKGLELIVAHYDHGIRPDSANDRVFVQQLADRYGLPFEYVEGHLGAKTSEATAREARYKFLEEVKEKHGAGAIVTAHHQDDVVETAIINLLRGTGRKGLTALGTRDGLMRPLLRYSKPDILDYAAKKGLDWHEDSTNTDLKYLRNYVRHVLVPKLSAGQKQRLIQLIEGQRSVNAQLDSLLLQQVEQMGGLERKWFIGLPHEVASEVMAAWLRQNGVNEFDRPTIERAVIGAKTAKVGKRIAIKKDVFLELAGDKLALRRKER